MRKQVVDEVHVAIEEGLESELNARDYVEKSNATNISDVPFLSYSPEIDSEI